MAGERVVVDTVVWSMLLRRRNKDLSPPDRQIAKELRDLIGAGRAILLGMVRMEILSGIADPAAFAKMEDHLSDFDDVAPDSDDYVRAARFWTRCRGAGVAASPVDMLICGVAAGRDLRILTADKDFLFYGKQLPIQLHGSLAAN